MKVGLPLGKILATPLRELLFTAAPWSFGMSNLHKKVGH